MNDNNNNNDNNSSILNRVKNFLPIIAQANKELEEVIKVSGKESIRIDNNLFSSEIENKNEENENESDEDDDNDNDNDESNDNEVEEVEEVEETKNNLPPVISIDFALGDFDGTPLAQLEEASQYNKNNSNSDNTEL